jgi:hypothetical protein
MVSLFIKKSPLIVLMIIVLVSSAHGLNKKSPSLAMLLCLAPGGGQFYTERYIPGIVISASEITLGYYAIKYHRDEEYGKRNSMLWWGLFVFGYSLADAYVGAKMYGFDIEADIDRVSVGYKFQWSW